VGISGKNWALGLGCHGPEGWQDDRSYIWIYWGSRGVYADWKPGKLGDKNFGHQTCSEYWVLGEEHELRQHFSDKGDSGSSVIDKDGVIRGIVFAQVRIKKVHIIIDPHSKIPDIAKIADQRNEDGNVDVDDVVTTVFERRCFIIVEDIEMILQRSGIGGKAIFNS
jgi:hypothetical protein